MFNVTQEQIDNIIKKATGINGTDALMSLVKERQEAITNGSFALPTAEDLAREAGQGESAYSQALEVMKNINVTPPNITQDDLDKAQEYSDEILEQFSFHGET